VEATPAAGVSRAVDQLLPVSLRKRANAGRPQRHKLVFLPASASWLNWIEAEFAALRYFALSGTGHRSHAEQAEAIAGYMRWRNARAEPKHDFAPESVIRTWTGLPDQRCMTRH
jgi:hypothetical protein